ncbi:MAG: hypothetical protein JWR26_1195 [Pedosphaera sp.]|nr:hypothetical protein [Pedosphaera sp.]
MRFLQTRASRGSRWEAIHYSSARALAFFFGGFSLLNLIGNLVLTSFDTNLWWIDLRVLPQFPANLFLVAASLCLVGFAVRPPQRRWRRVLTAGMVSILAVVAFWNVVEFYYLFAQGRLRPWLPVPMSLFVLAALGLILRVNSWAASPALPNRSPLVVVAAFAVCLIIFPVFQMICFGRTDYRRPADVAVVFGARAYADGRPSVTLADRVKTACQLYREGLTRKLIFSGGPGDGAIFETESMRRMAIGLGVKPEDILTDPAGLNTRATVENTEALFAKLGAKRILVVSHFYHLPRIKMAYQRAGWDVYTVPARESSLRQLAPLKSMGREVAAMWVYYFRPLIQPRSASIYTVFQPCEEQVCLTPAPALAPDPSSSRRG